jgi:hypothetical protein
MDKTVLKKKLHKFIDQIDSQNLLEEYYQEMKNLIQKSQVSIWDTLDGEQKKEVLLSYEESERDIDLIDNDSVMNKYKKWL